MVAYHEYSGGKYVLKPTTIRTVIEEYGFLVEAADYQKDTNTLYAISGKQRGVVVVVVV